ncbi:response regulator [Pseudonocardiaceae bacterium YIM PH 21723]|nr:response regulator [Pseudonocardiaceae bacterium YIM PH 21723]
MIRVLVVDDDMRVAQVHAAFAEQVPGFSVVGVAHSAAEARRRIAELRPDLLLLDHYLPDEPGMALLGRVDAIMLTAVADAAAVHDALARGALNYLVKPFTADQLADRLTAYARYRRRLSTPDRQLSQEDIDGAMRTLHERDKPPLPKGRSPVTARLVADALRASGSARSAAEVADQLGIARATAQRYLAALAQDGTVLMGMRYGLTGRPEHQYEWVADR